jgi:hypothetical protein
VSDDKLRAELERVGELRRQALRLRRETSAQLKMLIPRARAAGVPVAEISRLTGLTRAGVYEFLDTKA